MRTEIKQAFCIFWDVSNVVYDIFLASLDGGAGAKDVDLRVAPGAIAGPGVPLITSPETKTETNKRISDEHSPDEPKNKKTKSEKIDM